MRPAELDGPGCPPELAYLLAWFADLSSARGSNGFALMPIAYAEIAAWATLSGVEPTPFEVEVLRALDQTILRLSGDARRTGNPNHRG